MAVRGDVPVVVDLDRRAQLVRFAEEVALFHHVEVDDLVRRRLVVVRDAEAEREPRQALDGFRGNPRDRGDRRGNAHAPAPPSQERLRSTVRLHRPLYKRARDVSKLNGVQRADLLASPLDELCTEARRLRGDAFGTLVTYSPKVFIPLTKLCRDVCHYCTFARPPRRGERAYMPLDEVLDIARAGAAAGCREALFPLGDKPELRYRVAREELAELGCATTLEYLARAARLVLDETGLLPHLNPGVLSREDFELLRPVSASMGIMLETVSDRLSQRGGPHFGSPDKLPAARLETLRLAGEASVPFTTGILIGIGETRAERIEALGAIRRLHPGVGHVQEVIVQNFRAKPDTKMADVPDAPLEELLWTC